MARPCERQCSECGQWKHHSRFASRLRHRRPNSSVWHFNPRCRDCEQKARNLAKNADRARALIRYRAERAAQKADVPTEFFWIQMNYQSLVPIYRASLSPDGLCLSCGHKPLNERDLQIEHCEPPRFAKDWARLHARNLRLICGSCNRTKGHKPFAAWLDEQESARRANLATSPPTPPTSQGTLF